MEQSILIRGAWENNLKRIDLDIPKGKLVAFAGVSGSGKTSLVFDTIAAEAGRQLRDTFPPYVRSRIPRHPAPRVARIDRLSTAVVVGQRTPDGGVRSTVGTLTDTAPLLRLLYSRCAVPSAGPSNAYSFNDPAGCCPACSGLGYETTFDWPRILDTNKSLNQGAIRFPGHQPGACLWQVYANSGLYDPDKPLKDYTRHEWDDFLHGRGGIVTIRNTTGKVWGSSYQQTYEGFQDRIERLYLRRDIRTLSRSSQELVRTLTVRRPCPVCGGKRLNAAALESRLLGYRISDLGQMELADLPPILRRVQAPAGQEAADQLALRLTQLIDAGLGYLSLDRAADTLSGGELQRLKMVRHLGSSLVDFLYIFDEPSAGLHPSDIGALQRLLLGLRDRGNSVLLVEHNEQLLSVADQVVELGPAAGTDGGQVVFQGPPDALQRADTATGRYLRRKKRVKAEPRAAQGYLTVRNAARNNLKNLCVRFPAGCMTVVTGVSGAGKSSLVCDELFAQHPEAVLIRQTPIGTSSRSTPATYTGAWDDIRRLLARENRVSPQLFSFSSKGACPVCRGRGVRTIEMAFLDAVETPCEACGGKRFGPEALSYRYHGKNVLEILALTIDEAISFFADIPSVRRKLTRLQSVGLGYLTLGQPTSTLSGGECQRVKLASHMDAKGGLYLMDEPSAGLHGQDVEGLLGLLDRLTDGGNTLILAEHNPDVICRADWVIDLGPGGGKHGGHVLFEGTPAELLTCPDSPTAQALQALGVTKESNQY